jgi:hypothetical protein
MWNDDPLHIIRLVPVMTLSWYTGCCWARLGNTLATRIVGHIWIQCILIFYEPLIHWNLDFWLESLFNHNIFPQKPDANPMKQSYLHETVMPCNETFSSEESLVQYVLSPHDNLISKSDSGAVNIRRYCHSTHKFSVVRRMGHWQIWSTRTSFQRWHGHKDTWW